MRRLLAALTVVGLMVGIGSLYAAETEGDTWHGIITDEGCGKKHVEMSPEKAKACALSCAERGAKLVLYSMKDDKIFILSDQAKAKEFAGEHVVVSGTLSEDGNTITVTGIQKGEEKVKDEKTEK